MKAISVKGDDYAALDFERFFRNASVSHLIRDFHDTKSDFKKERPDAELELLDLNLDLDAFLALRHVWGDHDAMKTRNIFLEQTILR